MLQNKLNKTTLASVLLFSSTAIAADDTVPHIFSPSTPAKASEVNENFDALNNRLNELQEKSFGYLVKDGFPVFQVDCTDRPEALNEKYLENWALPRMSFEIKGSCYGDISQPRTEDQTYHQVHDQVIGIFGIDETAKIIDNDISGIVGLSASFGGGLYLYNLDIETASYSTPVLYSRNGQGTMRGVNLKMQSGGTVWAGLVVQEGAQVYLSDLNIEGFTAGIYAVNGGVMRTTGDIAISNVERGMVIEGSTIQNRDVINIDASSDSITLDIGSTFIGWDNTLNITSGGMNVQKNSVMLVNEINAPTIHVSVHQAALNVTGSITVESMWAGATNGDITSANITNFDLSTGTNFEAFNSQIAKLNINQASTFVSHNNNVGEINIGQDSFFDMISGSITGHTNLNDSSTAYMNNVNFADSATLHAASNSQVSLFGSTNLSEDKFNCYGGFVSIESVDVNAMSNGCIDVGGMAELVDWFKQNRAN